MRILRKNHLLHIHSHSHGHSHSDDQKKLKSKEKKSDISSSEEVLYYFLGTFLFKINNS